MDNFSVALWRDWQAGLLQSRARGVLSITPRALRKVLLVAADEQASFFEQESLNIAQALLEKLPINADDTVYTLGCSLKRTSQSFILTQAALPAVNQIKKHLGTSTAFVVVNAYQGFNPNFFAQVLGCLQAGGVLIFITPDLETQSPLAWSDFDDPDYQKLLSPPFSHISDIQPKRFLQRSADFLRCAQDDHPSLFVSLDEFFSGEKTFFKDALAKAEQTDHEQQGRCEEPSQAAQQLCLVQIQRATLSALEQDQTQAKAFILEGGRGCGKSALLGMLVNHLVQALPDLRIGVSAAVDAQLVSFYAFAGEHDNRVFIPPDELVHASVDVLIVDEAASIVTQFLKDSVAAAKVLIYATTTIGFEGNGRGFSIRFEHYLRKHLMVDKYVLNEPMRYAKNDVLERFTYQLLGLDSGRLNHRQGIVSAEIFSVKNLNYAWLSQDDLACDEALLQQVFTLLLEGHYQTSADDLRTLFDLPDLDIAVARLNEAVVAVVVICTEGGLEQSLVDSFNTEPRRFRGHLIAQTFAQLGDKQALALRYKRVMRIATHADFRRYGVASKLLGFAQNTYKKSGIDFLGTSFALEDDVLAFWRTNNFVPTYYGMRKESVTAKRSVICIKPLTDDSNVRFSKLQRLFFEMLRYRSDINVTVKLQLGLTETGVCENGLSVSVDDKLQRLSEFEANMLARFIFSGISFEVVEPVLRKWVVVCMQANAGGDHARALAVQLDILHQYFFQTENFQDVRSAKKSLLDAQGLTGKKAFSQYCRQFVVGSADLLNAD